MTIEEAIKNRERCLEYLEGSPAGAVCEESLEAVRLSLEALRHTQLDRSRWEGCETCNNTPGIMFGVITMAIGKRFLSTDEHELRYCPECGRPLNEKTWEELERKVFYARH